MTAPVTATGRVMVLRRAGHLWGIDHAQVETVERDAGRFRVGLGGTEIAADEILGIFEGMTTRPAGAVLPRYWSESASALAVHGTTPIVVIDPRRPPAMLRLHGEGTGDEQAT